MANDLVVKLLLKTGAFSTDLKTAKAEIQNFQSGCSKAGDSLSAFGKSMGINIGSLTKFGTAVGVAAIAGKELKNIMDSSQTTADAFTNAISGCKGVIDSFRSSVATMDFSAFRDGLWSVYDAAKAVSEALDKLGNTQIAYNYMSKENAAEFDSLEAIYKNPQATKEQKDAAIKRMQEIIDAQVKYAKNYGADIYDLYRKKVVNKAGKSNLNLKDVTLEQFRTAMRTDLGEFGDSTKRRDWYQNQYDEYLKKRKEYGKNNLVEQERLKKEYADVIAIRAMLELMKDDELKELGDLLSTRLGAQQTADQLQKRYNEMLNGYLQKKTTVSTTKTIKTPEEISQEGSLNDLTKKYTEANKALGNMVYGTDEWTAQNKVVQDLKKQVDELTNKIKEYNGELEKTEEIVEESGPAQGSMEYLSNIISNATKQRDASVFGSEEYKKWDREKARAEKVLNSNLRQNVEKAYMDIYLGDDIDISIDKIDSIIKTMEQLRKTMTIGSDDFLDYTEIIDKLTDMRNKALGITTTVDLGTDKWDDFNNAMSATSTIVNNLTNTFRENTEVTTASILSMVANSLPAIGQLISSISALTAVETTEAGVAATAKAVSTSKHWIEAIAAIASIGAAVASAVSAAKSAGKYATGGIVGGSSFTGDRMVANVNSGEMILTRTQQANLFRQINAGYNMGGEVVFHISGTDLEGVLKNYNRKYNNVR